MFRRKRDVTLRRSYQARVFSFTTKLPGPRFSIYDEITSKHRFTTNLQGPRLRRSYQARVFPFTTKLRGIDLTIYDEVTMPVLFLQRFYNA